MTFLSFVLNLFIYWLKDLVSLSIFFSILLNLLRNIWLKLNVSELMFRPNQNRVTLVVFVLSHMLCPNIAATSLPMCLSCCYFCLLASFVKGVRLFRGPAMSHYSGCSLRLSWLWIFFLIILFLTKKVLYVESICLFYVFDLLCVWVVSYFLVLLRCTSA